MSYCIVTNTFLFYSHVGSSELPCLFHISVSARFLQGLDESIFIHQPLVYCHFALGVGEPRYHQVRHVHTHKLVPIYTQCCSHQASIYSLLTMVIKYVSLIVFDFDQFSMQTIVAHILKNLMAHILLSRLICQKINENECTVISKTNYLSFLGGVGIGS